MAKTLNTAGEPKGTQSSSVAILQSDYTALVGKVANANDAMDKGRARKSELIADAVDNAKLHKTAFAWVMKLRKMDPVKRNELLFHFDVYCDYEKFAREDLLSDRADVNGVARGTDEDGEPDPRPTHLRRPGASAASNPVQELATKTGAKTSGTSPIDSVGRGPKPH